MPSSSHVARSTPDRGNPSRRGGRRGPRSESPPARRCGPRPRGRRRGAESCRCSAGCRARRGRSAWRSFRPSIEPRQCSNCPIGKGFVQLPALCRFAGLHSLYKGANKRRRIAVFRPSPGPEAAGPTATAHCPSHFWPMRFAGLRADGLTGQRGTWTVTATSAEPTRRDFLYIATGTVAAVGGAATLVPLIAQMNPDASTIAAGAPVEVDLTPIAEGQVIKVFWRGKPIFISHRTKKEIEEARKRQRLEPARSAGRREARQARQGRVAGPDRHLHPSRLHPARAPGQLRRLVLPVPRLAVRHLGPHPAGSGAEESAAAPLQVPLRLQDPDRRRGHGQSLRFR